MHTNTLQKAPRACDSKGLHTDTNASYFASHGPIQQATDAKTFITRLTAVYARMTGAIGMVDLALALMAAQFALVVWGAF